MTAILTQAEHRAEAERLLPGGVGATGRINSCLGHALYVSRADGCRIWDLDGKEYIDFNLAHGSAFLGYKHPAVRRALVAPPPRRSTRLNVPYAVGFPQHCVPIQTKPDQISASQAALSVT